LLDCELQRSKGRQRRDVANLESSYVFCVAHVVELSILRTLPFEIFWKEGQRQSRKLLYLLRRPGRSTEHITPLAVSSLVEEKGKIEKEEEESGQEGRAEKDILQR